MKQEIKQTLMAIVGLLLCTTAFAHDFEVDDIYYNITDATAQTVAVTYKGSNYSSYSDEYIGAITIPSSVTYNGSTTYSVTSIGEYAFRGCNGLTSVTIPNSVTSIGKSAFYGCTGLTEVTIPNSVTEIGSSAFYGCTGLTSVTIPNSVTEIGSYAFYGCTGLTSVTIGNSVTSIGNKAFEDCSGLTEVNISDLSAWCKIEFGDSYANPLYYDRKLKLNGTEIKDLVIPNDITKIKNYAFCRYSSLTIVTIPNSVTEIGESAFSGCTGLTSVTIPNSVTEIGQSAFSCCRGLTSVTIPNSVTAIGDYAFYECNLTEVTIPNSVTEIGNGAFGYCYGLKEVIIEDGTETLSLGYNSHRFSSIVEGLFYDCRLEKLYLGRNLSYDSSKECGDSPFSSISTLRSVTIGNSVTEIGNKAFYGCTNLAELIIEDGTETLSLGYNSYSYSSSYTGQGLFYDCPLEKLYLGRNLSYDSSKGCGYSPFYNKTILKLVTIGNSVTKIGYNAFKDCYGLTEVTIGNSVTEIGYNAFKDCRGLTSVTIPNSVTKIGQSAFIYCYGLTKVNYNAKNCTSMGSYYDPVFSGCTNLKTVNIGNEVETIPSYAFDGCKGLTEVTIGNSVKSIGEQAFDDCERLNTIVSLNPTPPTCYNSDSFSSYIYSKATLYVSKDSFAKYYVEDVWRLFSNIKKIKITLSQTEANLPVNDFMTLTYTVTPSNTPVEWTTSNQNVAFINKNADNSVSVLGMADGVATITATATDGSGISASCKVIVGVSGIEGVEADNNATEVVRYDIHGRLLTEPTKGINIVKYSDGTTRKEIVK